MTAPAPLSGVSLPALIHGVTTSRAAVLDQLGEAMVVAEHLDRIGDDLIGHFVARARDEGVSWSRIGERMGVSKQAAQQRFRSTPGADPLPPLEPSLGFARFTVDARNVVAVAHDRARVDGHAVVTPAHLTAAALADRGRRLGLTADDIATAVAPALAAVPSAADARELVPYDDAAQTALARAFTEAIDRDAPFVDVPHLLLALLHTEDDAGPLHRVGVTADALEAQA